MNMTFINAVMACSLFSLSAGPLGCLMVWRRLSFLSDTLSHAALLGVALSLCFNLPITLGVICVDLLIVYFLIQKTGQELQANEARLAIASQVSLAGGLIIFNVIPAPAYQLNQFLFGDVLALSSGDLVSLAVLAVITWFLTIKYYRHWILSWISDELAVTHAINPQLSYIIVVALLALAISLAIKILGALLITALMIIPVMSVRYLASTAKSMMIYAAVIGVLSSIAGLLASYHYDIPASAAITVAAAILYLLSSLRK